VKNVQEIAQEKKPKTHRYADSIVHEDKSIKRRVDTVLRNTSNSCLIVYYYLS